MKRRHARLGWMLVLAGAGRSLSAVPVTDEVDAVYPQSDALYLDLHRHPELSFHEGPTTLLRTELDALPVEENTGLPYASTVRTKDAPREPLVEGAEGCYALVNDPALTQRVADALVRELGPQVVKDAPPEMASEDFSEFQRAGVPTLMLRVGAVERVKYDECLRSGAILPSLHSALFAPDRERTIKGAVAAEVIALRELMPANATRAP